PVFRHAGPEPDSGIDSLSGRNRILMEIESGHIPSSDRDMPFLYFNAFFSQELASLTVSIIDR
ncbi:MAG: hypothetical protein ACLTJB_03130, partial [Holdemania filiformis]